MFIKVLSDQTTIYPYNLDLIRLESPEISFPENIIPHLQDLNIFLVTQTTPPQYNPLIQGIQEQPPQKNEQGIYETQWLVFRTTIALEDEARILLAEAKRIKLLEIEDAWQKLESAGWDSGAKFNLGITPSDVALLVGVYVLAKEASTLGLPIPSIIAKDNSSIQFATFTDMTTLLLRYGAARAELSSTFALKRKAVEAATTLEEVNAVG
jgi:hypothetical protein